MLIRFPAGGSAFVWLTDEPQTAETIRQKEPVIGITGPEPEGYVLWSGISYLAETVEAVDEAYAELVWCRFYGYPVTVLETEEWRLREMDETDLPFLCRMYQIKDVRRYLEHPTGGDDSREAWTGWIKAYCQHVYRMDEPAIWILTDRKGQLLGRIGLEWREVCGKEGYFLGYALMPEARKKGLATRVSKALLACMEERWGITDVYLSCEKENQASIACAKRLGFEYVCEDQTVVVFFISVSMS